MPYWERMRRAGTCGRNNQDAQQGFDAWVAAVTCVDDACTADACVGWTALVSTNRAVEVLLGGAVCAGCRVWPPPRVEDFVLTHVARVASDKQLRQIVGDRDGGVNGGSLMMRCKFGRRTVLFDDMFLHPSIVAPERRGLYLPHCSAAVVLTAIQGGLQGVVKPRIRQVQGRGAEVTYGLVLQGRDMADLVAVHGDALLTAAVHATQASGGVVPQWAADVASHATLWRKLGNHQRARRVAGALLRLFVLAPCHPMFTQAVRTPWGTTVVDVVARVATADAAAALETLHARNPDATDEAAKALAHAYAAACRKRRPADFVKLACKGGLDPRLSRMLHNVALRCVLGWTSGQSATCRTFRWAVACWQVVFAGAHAPLDVCSRLWDGPLTALIADAARAGQASCLRQLGAAVARHAHGDPHVVRAWATAGLGPYLPAALGGDDAPLLPLPDQVVEQFAVRAAARSLEGSPPFSAEEGAEAIRAARALLAACSHRGEGWRAGPAVACVAWLCWHGHVCPGPGVDIHRGLVDFAWELLGQLGREGVSSQEDGGPQEACWHAVAPYALPSISQRLVAEMGDAGSGATALRRALEAARLSWLDPQVYAAMVGCQAPDGKADAAHVATGVVRYLARAGPGDVAGPILHRCVTCPAGVDLETVAAMVPRTHPWMVDYLWDVVPGARTPAALGRLAWATASRAVVGAATALLKGYGDVCTAVACGGRTLEEEGMDMMGGRGPVRQWLEALLAYPALACPQLLSFAVLVAARPQRGWVQEYLARGGDAAHSRLLVACPSAVLLPEVQRWLLGHAPDRLMEDMDALTFLPQPEWAASGRYARLGEPDPSQFPAPWLDGHLPPAVCGRLATCLYVVAGTAGFPDAVKRRAVRRLARLPLEAAHTTVTTVAVMRAALSVGVYRPVRHLGLRCPSDALKAAVTVAPRPGVPRFHMRGWMLQLEEEEPKVAARLFVWDNFPSGKLGDALDVLAMASPQFAWRMCMEAEAGLGKDLLPFAARLLLGTLPAPHVAAQCWDQLAEVVDGVRAAPTPVMITALLGSLEEEDAIERVVFRPTVAQQYVSRVLWPCAREGRAAWEAAVSSGVLTPHVHLFLAAVVRAARFKTFVPTCTCPELDAMAEAVVPMLDLVKCTMEQLQVLTALCTWLVSPLSPALTQHLQRLVKRIGSLEHQHRAAANQQVRALTKKHRVGSPSKKKA